MTKTPSFLFKVFKTMGLVILTSFLTLNSVQSTKINLSNFHNTREPIMSHAQVVIYTTSVCPYCIRAKKLLDKKGVAYTEIDVSNDSEKRLTMIEKAGGRTSVPQIFIDKTHVGGCDDLYALEQKGGLDTLLHKKR